MNDFQNMQKGIRMANEMAQTNEPQNTTNKGKRIVQIVLAFEADTDEETLAVKKAVDTAIADLGEIQVTLTSRNLKGMLPMMRR